GDIFSSQGFRFAFLPWLSLAHGRHYLRRVVAIRAGQRRHLAATSRRVSLIYHRPLGLHTSARAAQSLSECLYCGPPVVRLGDSGVPVACGGQLKRQSGLLGQTTGMPGADVDGSTNAKNVPFGVKISPSATLQNLLRHYPSGGQFFLEALQNAEDTDRATHFCALLDLSTHPIEQIRPQQSVWRRRLQGPAILFYDNGGFRDKDWKSLQQIYNSSKKHSPSEVGKYGMGSRSFFHIGDILQIVSGSKYAILDPDERLSENGE
ncbi:unnamed protein product, partial [Effrenium voratum]